MLRAGSILLDCGGSGCIRGSSPTDKSPSAPSDTACTNTSPPPNAPLPGAHRVVPRCDVAHQTRQAGCVRRQCRPGRAAAVRRALEVRAHTPGSPVIAPASSAPQALCSAKAWLPHSACSAADARTSERATAASNLGKELRALPSTGQISGGSAYWWAASGPRAACADATRQGLRAPASHTPPAGGEARNVQHAGRRQDDLPQILGSPGQSMSLTDRRTSGQPNMKLPTRRQTPPAAR